VTLVEFADFECPFCGVMAPRLEKLAAERAKDLRVVFKYMPLPAHPHGEIAARAAFAASQQGKFWEMNKKLFENQKHLETADLEGYAKDLKLDLNKFRTDMNSPAATERLERDRKLADAVGVKGTPTIFINGRNVDLSQDLNEWINFELNSTSPDKGSLPEAANPKPGNPGNP
jgi:protein-disulfide isomerase